MARMKSNACEIARKQGGIGKTVYPCCQRTSNLHINPPQAAQAEAPGARAHRNLEQWPRPEPGLLRAPW